MTKFICVGGKAQNGKDTTSNFLKEHLEKTGNKVLVTHFADLLKYICRNYFDWDGNKDEYGRSLLQNVGTNGIRKKDPDYWVDFLLFVVSCFPDKWDYVIVSDTRFPNEVDRIVESGYPTIYIRVCRPNFDNGLTEEQKQHPSEVALDNYEPDYTIINNRTLDELNDIAEFLSNEIISSEANSHDWGHITFSTRRTNNGHSN